MARILLAEDDSSLRGFLTRALERAGHQVIDCENGDDAIDALEHGPYDLLLTDIVMPGADGIEVARVAAARQPGLRIMFITGFAAVALTAAQGLLFRPGGGGLAVRSAVAGVRRGLFVQPVDLSPGGVARRSRHPQRPPIAGGLEVYFASAK